MTNLIRWQPIQLITRLFMALSFFTREGLLDGRSRRQFLSVVKSLVQYVATFAAQYDGLPGRHPLRQLLLLLGEVDADDLNALAKAALRVNLESFRALRLRGGQSNFQLILWIIYSQHVGPGALPQDLGDVFERAVVENKATLGEDQ